MLFIGDTDSMKLRECFDNNVIINYNKSVVEKLKKDNSFIIIIYDYNSLIV